MNNNPDLLSIWNACKFIWILNGVIIIWVFLSYSCIRKYREDYGVLAKHLLPFLVSISVFVFFISLSNFYYIILMDGKLEDFNKINSLNYILTGMAAFIASAVFSGLCTSSGGSRFFNLPIKCFFKYTPNILKQLPITKDDASMWNSLSTKVSLMPIIMGVLLCGLEFYKFSHFFNILNGK